MHPTVMVLVACASLLPAGVGIWRFKKLSVAMKVYATLCVLSTLEIAGEFVLTFDNRKSTILSNSALGVEAVALMAVYALAVNEKTVRRVMVALVLFFVCIWAPGVWFLHAPTQFNEEMAIVSRISILFSSVIALYAIARRTTRSLTDEPLFWITSGNIFFSTGVIFILAVSNDLLALSTPYFTAAWNLNWSLVIVADIVFAKGLLCRTISQT
jgi:hypothetical protein